MIKQMKFGVFFKFIGTAILGFFGVIATLLFEPNVFRGVTLPLAARAVGWKARAESARLTPLGKLQIEGMELVNPAKSRVDLDSALVLLDLESLLTGKPEIIEADFKFGLIDLEWEESSASQPLPAIPFTLREANLEIIEGRIRKGAGAWILGRVKGQAKGWDGQSPREIQGKIEKLSWNGRGQEELTGSAGFQAQKSVGVSNLALWEGQLTVDLNTVVDFSPVELVAPCRLVLQGQISSSPDGDWKMEKMHGAWEGVGGVKVATSATGQWNRVGDWGVDLSLDPVDLDVVGVLFQSRGVKAVEGNLGGVIHLDGGDRKPIQGRAKLLGQGVQIASSLGLLWPARPAELAGSVEGAWTSEGKNLRINKFQIELGQKGGARDLQASLDRPAEFCFQDALPKSTETATLQWVSQGMELAAVVPLFVSPKNLKVQGGQLSAKGEAKIQGGSIQVAGGITSRAMRASGDWIQGDLQGESVGVQFRGVVEGGKKILLEEATFQAAWAGGEAQDLKGKVTAEWDTSKRQGWVMADGEGGLAGLGQAWSGAKHWPDSGQVKLHLEFSGNLQDQGKGLVSLSLDNMHWAGEVATPWRARMSSEVIHQAGQWRLPEFVGQADRGGQVLLNSKGLVEWAPSKGEGKGDLEIVRVESSCLVPILGLVTPNWKWQAAEGSGSFHFERKGSQDRVRAKMDGAITVETGTPEQSRLVDFSSILGGVQATWPSGSSGKLSVEELSLQARHRDGRDALRASLDQVMTLEKVGNDEWRPGGQEVATGSVEYTGWPIGLFGPLIFPNTKETSLMGTSSGFVKVRCDPKKGKFEGDVELDIPDFTIDLPRIQLQENQVRLKAGLTLGDKGEVNVPRASLDVQKGGKSWLNCSVQRENRPALLVKGTVDLGILKNVWVGISENISGGSMTLQAEVGDLKDGGRTIGYSVVIPDFSGGPVGRGGVTGAEVRSQGILSWNQGCQAIKEVELTAKSANGNLSLSKLTWLRDGAWAWEGARFSEGWVAWLVNPWLKPSRWVDGDVILGPGFWQPAEYGGSGELDLSLVGARLVENPKEEDISFGLTGSFDYDTRTKSLNFKDGNLVSTKFQDDPVVIPALRIGKNSVSAQVRGGTLDLRGLLAQTEAIRNAKPAAGTPPAVEDPWKVDLSLDLTKIIVEEAEVGPIHVPRFRWGPEGIYLDPSVVQVKGGVIRASLVQDTGLNQPVQANLVMNKFPLGAILGNVITDAKGPIGGWIDLQLVAQAAKPTLEEVRKSLSGQGSFRLYQAHLERLPSLQKALAAAGTFLGSSFIAGSEINDLGSNFTLQGERINVPDLKVSGTALSANLDGWLNWWSQTLDFNLKFALTKEAMQSSGQLQGVMTQLVGSSNDYYTKIPGSATITGTIQDPKVNMDVSKMLAEAGINLLINAPVGILQGAGGAAGSAAGAATQPAGAILQGVGSLFKW